MMGLSSLAFYGMAFRVPVVSPIGGMRIKAASN